MAVTMKLALVLFALLLPSTVYSRTLFRSARDAKPEDAPLAAVAAEKPDVASPPASSVAPLESSTLKPAEDAKKEEPALVASSAKPSLNSHEPGHVSPTDLAKPEASSQASEVVSNEPKPTSAALEADSTPASVKVTGVAASEDASAAKQTPTTAGSSTEVAVGADASPSTPKQ